jgi:hypothetical protein
MIKLRFQSWIGLGVLLVSQVHAQANPDWTIPIDPFRIAGNLYYVGSKDLASYLYIEAVNKHKPRSLLEALLSAD